MQKPFSHLFSNFMTTFSRLFSNFMTTFSRLFSNLGRLFKKKISTFSALFDNLRHFKTTLFVFVFVFVLFAMQYKVRLGRTKRYHLFQGGGCVKAISRTALLLSKTAISFSCLLMKLSGRKTSKFIKGNRRSDLTCKENVVNYLFLQNLHN